MGWFGREKHAKDSVDPDLQSYYDNALSGRASFEVKTSKEDSRTPVATQPRGKTLRQVAMDNCVEFERSYSNCLLHGTFWERLTSCPTQKAMHEECKDMQTRALEVLGWRSANSAGEQQTIKAKADDLMIKHSPSLIITESQVSAFNEDLGRFAHDS